jgi:uncharacterized membrane protein YedE/YeeE
MSTRHVAFGLAFGFILVRAGATAYDAIAGMFLLQDLHLVGVIGVAIATSALGFVLMRRGRVKARTGEPLALAAKPMQKGLVAGGLLFGAGWAIAGTCPGTALAQIGEGRLAGLFTLAGILIGAWLQQRTARQRVAAKAELPSGAAVPAR